MIEVMYRDQAAWLLVWMQAAVQIAQADADIEQQTWAPRLRWMLGSRSRCMG